MKFEEIRNWYNGETIHVIGASKMMDSVKPEFFEDKITIGANFAYQHFPIKYTISRHWKVIKEWIGEDKPNSELWHPEYTNDLGGFEVAEYGNYFYDRTRSRDGLVFRSRGIMGTALSLAYWMGAKKIVLWGVACDNNYMKGYNGMSGGIATSLFMEQNENNVLFMVEYLSLNGVDVEWVMQVKGDLIVSRDGF